MSRALVMIGAFGTAADIKKRPASAVERVRRLRGELVARGDVRVKDVDRVLRVLEAQP